MAVNLPVFIAGYAVVINAAAFLMMAADKSRARRGAFRISEKALFLSAIVGGGIGAWAGMYCFRHKTKHLKFVVGMPVLALIQLFAAVFAVSKFYF